MSGAERTRDFPPALFEAMREIREDREHGASWLARRGAQALADAAVLADGGSDPRRLMAALRTAMRSMAQLRPSMAAIANTVARIWAVAAERAPQDDAAGRIRAVHDAAQGVVASWDESGQVIARLAAPLLGVAVCTHSRSGTVEAVLREHATDPRDGMPRRLIIGEGRPGGEGVALARVLAGAGWSVTLIPDAAYGEMIDEIEVVLLGADAVHPRWGIVNKVGSDLLALAARDEGVPVYVLCETLKIAAPGFTVELEVMDPRDLLPEPVERVHPHNVYFDLTPMKLITGIVTERGILKPEEVAPIAEEAGRALALLRGP